ncbi:hypothetical protein [Pseudonocardia sp. TRM90224]|uniref:hypothetical protein n=1 Tax=Pseudonocardia sp. TRM90224 TaxID=2812678 RepID=UPI001E64A33E|nr:hypothetical protein [Pseudonocardia sp. TRM90224]
MSDEPEGGDAVCWLDRLCPECGAMPTAESPDRCWRCGAARDGGDGERPRRPSGGQED